MRGIAARRRNKYSQPYINMYPPRSLVRERRVVVVIIITITIIVVARVVVVIIIIALHVIVKTVFQNETMRNLG